MTDQELKDIFRLSDPKIDKDDFMKIISEKISVAEKVKKTVENKRRGYDIGLVMTFLFGVIFGAGAAVFMIFHPVEIHTAFSSFISGLIPTEGFVSELFRWRYIILGLAISSLSLILGVVKARRI